MTCLVNGGQYAVARDGNAVYLGAVTASAQLTFDASNPLNPRVDYVVIRVQDPGVDGTGITASAQLLILKGDPAPIPDEPSSDLQDGDLVLAAVGIRANTSTIVQSDIIDRRSFVVARGGIAPSPSNDDTPGSYDGQYRDSTAAKTLDRWTAGEWLAVASPAQWNETSPTLYTGGKGNTPGYVPVALGTGSSTKCRYIALGKRLDLQFDFIWGAPPYNGGSGSINTRLPEGYYSRAFGGDQALTVNLNVPYNSSSWLGRAYVQANSNIVFIQFPIAMEKCALQNYTIALTAGTPGEGCPIIPGGFPEGGGLSISGSIEIA